MKDARKEASAMLLGLALVPCITLALGLSAQGCGPSSTIEEGDAGSDTGSNPSTPVVETLHPDAEPLPGEAECTVVTTTGIPVSSAIHVPLCTKVKYATNPPSGGDHWEKWVSFKEYAAPVPREMYVHSMEHGAVILSYRCDDGCPEIVDALREVRDGLTIDPKCVQYAGTPTRIVITPDPELDTPIAASAWGATYTATCIDKASLASFIAKTYAKTYEDICFPGVDVSVPGAGPMCDRG